MNHGRRALLMTTAVLPFSAFAQQPKKIYRIGYLSGRGGFERQDEAFRQRLRDLGDIEGKNLVVEWRFNRGQNERNSELVAEMIRLKVDCIAAGGVGLTRAAKQATATIPIVILNIDGDPVELGFVASLARPGGNVTGFTGIAYELAAKRLELLKELVPKATRVGVLVPSVPAPVLGGSEAHLKGTEIAARKLGIQLTVLGPRNPDELESLFSELRNERLEALSVVGIGWINSHRERVIGVAARLKLPAIYSHGVYVPIVGLMSYAADLAHQFGEAAGYVAKILGGAKPADLPVQQPTRFELVINMKTAKALGLTIPPTIMVRADRIIE